MDQRDVELSKINFLLENLYAIVFRKLGATADDMEGVATEMVRQASLPASTFGREMPPEEMRQYQEMLAQRLDIFFAAVRQRLASDQGRPRPR